MMAAPVYDGMPPTDRTFRVLKPGGKEAWGEIRCGGPCRDDYLRVQIYHQDEQRYIKLQRAALASVQDAEKAIGGKIYVTGSWRSCSLQSELYASNTSRYAPAPVTAHCRGLAIDVSQNQPTSKLAAIDEELRKRHWHQARSDEPWHYSFGIQV